MAESEPLEQPTVHNIDVESFVLYRSPTGDSYHTQPRCASEPDIPPELDAANDLLEGVEMYRAGEIKQELTSENLCCNCAGRLQRLLVFES